MEDKGVLNMKLKTWQKWGIWFGGVHVLLWVTVTYFSHHPFKCFNGCGPSIDIVFYWIDFPVTYPLFLIKGIYDPELFSKYYLIIGTMFYSAVGIIINKVTTMLKNK